MARPRSPKSTEKLDVEIEREKAKLRKELALAEKYEMDAAIRRGDLCERAEAARLVRGIAAAVNRELERATAYLDPSLPAEVRIAAQHALRVAAGRVKAAIKPQVEEGVPTPPPLPELESQDDDGQDGSK